MDNHPLWGNPDEVLIIDDLNSDEVVGKQRIAALRRWAALSKKFKPGAKPPRIYPDDPYSKLKNHDG